MQRTVNTQHDSVGGSGDAIIAIILEVHI